MGKFVYAVMMVFSIEFALWFFGGSGFNQTSLFGILFDPTTLLSNPLYATVILVTLAAFAASVIIPGNFYQINIFALYAGIIVAFMSFAFSIVHLFQFIYGQLSAISSISLNFAQPITILIVSPLLAFYIMAMMEWVRSNT